MLQEAGNYAYIPGTVETNIMGMFTPETLPVISTLAKEYVVFDRWFASAPTQTYPNRNFASPELLTVIWIILDIYFMLLVFLGYYQRIILVGVCMDTILITHLLERCTLMS